MILAGDIGGTKTLLGLFGEKEILPPPGSTAPLLFERSYPSRQFPSFAMVLEGFLADAGAFLPASLSLSCSTFGVAGPVVGGRCETTNLPWILDTVDLAQILRLDPSRIWLINDLAAIAWGTMALSPSDLTVLNAGIPEKGGTMAIIAPGTGLGESIIAHSDLGPVVLSTEGGHTDWAPDNSGDLPLLLHLWEKFGHASCERLISGPGIATLYRFHTLNVPKERLPLPETLSDEDLPASISQRAMSDGDPLCKQTLDHFCGLFGQEAGNMALKSLATGGVFLAGGIPGKILPFLLESRFMERFINKGRYRKLLSNVPVWIVKNPDTGLLGAWVHSRSRYPSGKPNGGPP